MTYSIVAYDPSTRQFGVAVQTHQPAVGAIVPWVRAGVGAVATQSLVNISFGPRGLELLGQGLSAQQTLEQLIGADEGRQHRQLAVIDRAGNAAAYSGQGCIPYFGHEVGEHFSVQANMMARPTVPGAMAEAYRRAGGDLMHRLMCALEAAEAQGGDIRGSQSAAIVVYASEDKPQWENRICDLRVDEHAHPVAELRRLVSLCQAEHMSQRVEAQAEALAVSEILAGFAAARQASADASEMAFWQALFLADTLGQLAEARTLLLPLFAAEPQWRELLQRLLAMGTPPNGLLEHPETLAALLV